MEETPVVDDPLTEDAMLAPDFRPEEEASTNFALDEVDAGLELATALGVDACI